MSLLVDCKACGASIPKTAKFCPECGAVQGGASAEPTLRERFARPGEKAEAKAGAKAKAGKDKDKDKEPTAEELKKNGPSNLKPGTWVEIFDLESGDGKKLNGQQGRVTKYIYDKIRYEVSLGQKKVSIRPVNLKVADKPDQKWTYGNTCRLVCLHDEEDEALRDSCGLLGTLMYRSGGSAWSVIANGKIQTVHCEQLKVCTDEDEVFATSRVSQAFLSLLVVVTFHILFAAGIVVMKASYPELFHVHDDEFDQEPTPLGKVLNPRIPSTYVAGLSATTAVWSFLVLWGTVLFCSKMHHCLWDPLTTFPQIAELSLGRKSARVMYRFGFGMVATMLLAGVFLHQKIVMPHLPVLGTAQDDAFFWGCVAVGGVACQGAVLLETQYGWQTLLQRFAAVVMIWALYKHTNATMSLYLPGVQTSTAAWFQVLRDYVADGHMPGPSEEEQAAAALVQQARELAAKNPFIRDPAVQTAVIMRYHVLSYWPSALLVLPVFSSILEKLPDNAKASGSALLRNLFAWLQWFLLLLCSLVHLSYVPDLVVASLLAVPLVSED